MEEHSKFKYKKYIFPSEKSPLNSIPFHSDSKDIKRFFSNNFPIHLVIHEINGAERKEGKYVEKHNHPKPEINILLGNVKYKVALGDEEYIVQAPANIWIPGGLNHSAMLIEGKGYFVCLILGDKYIANGK